MRVPLMTAASYRMMNRLPTCVGPSGREVALQVGACRLRSAPSRSPTADDPFVGAFRIFQTFAFLGACCRAVIVCGNAPVARADAAFRHEVRLIYASAQPSWGGRTRNPPLNSMLHLLSHAARSRGTHGCAPVDAFSHCIRRTVARAVPRPFSIASATAGSIWM